VLQENVVSYSTRVWRDSISAGRLFLVWIRKRPHQSSSPKDDGLDEVNEMNEMNEVNEVNEVILLTLSDEPFLLYLLYCR
jgi:hypothetical protein